MADIREKERSVDQQPERDHQQDFVTHPARDGKFRWGFRGMTVRDWLPIVGALLIPVVVALGTGAITWQQAKLEDRRAQAERDLAAQRAQDEALQAYLDRMNTLIFDEGLLHSGKGTEVRMLARAYTLTILERIPDRRSAVLQFLVESDLVNAKQNAAPIISLADANLEGAKMLEPNLRSADLRYADLENAKLRRANLKLANLEYADGLSNKEIERQVFCLKDATMTNGQTYEDWRKDIKDKQNSKEECPHSSVPP